jgi:hypothetical protein
LHFFSGSAGLPPPAPPLLPPAAKLNELAEVIRKAARERNISFFIVDLHAYGVGILPNFILLRRRRGIGFQINEK